MSNKTKAINGAKWTTISNLVNICLQFAQIAVLARMMEPTAFGIVSICILINNFLSIFAHFGFANSIIYKQESDRKILSTIYIFNIMTGLLMFVIIYISIPFLVLYYKEPRLAEVLRLSAFYLPIVFLGQIYSVLLEKELQFKSVAFTDILCSVLGTSVTIVLAYNGYQAKSIIYGLLVSQIMRLIIQNIIGRKYFSPIFYFNLSKIKEHLNFGIYNIGDSLVGFANGNLDTILIGGLLDVKQLGYYTIASQVAVYPIVRLSPLVIQVVYPIMAKLKDNLGQLKNAYLKVVDVLAYCNIPLQIGLYLMAANVIPLIYGPGWGATIPLIRVFIFMGIFSCLTYPLSTVAYSTGKPKLLFFFNLGNLIIKFPLIYIIAIHYGVIGIAVGLVITTFITLILSFFIIQHILGDFIKQLLKDIIKPVSFSLIMAVTILLYKHFIGDTGVVNTIIQIAIGGLVYAALTLKYKLSLSEIMSLKKSL
jgi:lipopolysaccharide exporter